MSSEQTITLRLEDSPCGELKAANPDRLRSYAESVGRKGAYTAALLLEWLADQVEEQIKPPKPEEPTGLGAVVEDAEGQRWVRAFHHPHETHRWQNRLSGRRTYDGIDAVRVLSEGVQS